MVIKKVRSRTVAVEERSSIATQLNSCFIKNTVFYYPLQKYVMTDYYSI